MCWLISQAKYPAGSTYDRRCSWWISLSHGKSLIRFYSSSRMCGKFVCARPRDLRSTCEAAAGCIPGRHSQSSVDKARNSRKSPQRDWTHSRYGWHCCYCYYMCSCYCGRATSRMNREWSDRWAVLLRMRPKRRAVLDMSSHRPDSSRDSHSECWRPSSWDWGGAGWPGDCAMYIKRWWCGLEYNFGFLFFIYDESTRTRWDDDDGEKMSSH